MIYLNNNTEVQEIFIPKQEITAPANPKPTYENGFEDGKKVGFNEGREYQKDQLLNLYVTENGQYEREDGWGVVTVDVPIEGSDCSEAYDKGFEDGYNQGQAECPEGGSCNLEDKWVTPSMSERDDNGLIVVNPSEGYDGMSRTVIDPQTIYDEGVTAGKAEGSDLTLGTGDIYLTANDRGQRFEVLPSEFEYDAFDKFIVELENFNLGGDANIYDALSVNQLLMDGVISYGNNYIFKGEITEIQRIRPEYGDARYTLDGSLNVYNGQTMGYDLQVGDNVIVYGTLSEYNGAPQFSAGSEIKAWWREGGDCPELTSIDITENGSYEGAFSLVNVNVPQEGCDDAYNQGYQDGYNQGQNDCPSEGGCNLEDKWVTPSMDERDGNGLIVVSPSDGYDGLSRTVIDPQTIYNEGIEEGKNQGGSCNLGILDMEATDPYYTHKYASDDGLDGYSEIIVRTENLINQEKENAINEFKNQMQEITITENGTYSIDDTELVKSIAFDGNSYFDTGIIPTEDIKIEVCIKVTDGNDAGMGGIIIGGGIAPVDYQNYYGDENRGIAIGMGGGAIYGVWGATRSYNNPYEYEKTTTVVLQKTDDSWGWEGEKGSFGASTLYIGGYNRNGEEVEEKFTQSIVYIKIWTNRNDDSTLITYVPNTNGNFDANGVELQRLGDGTTTYVEEYVNIYPNGFKRVEVNVIPKIRNYEGVKFGHSTFTDCPFNIDEIGNYDYMFFDCKNLVNPPIINAQISSAVYMFSGCESLVNGGDYDTSNATDLSGMYGGCRNLQYVGSIDCSSLPNSIVGWEQEAQIFGTSQYIYLTDFGGFINLKQVVNLKGLIALNEQSVINIFNGLYDFVGNNETPNAIQGKLTMSSFITNIVEAHKSIAENKGWTITIE